MKVAEADTIYVDPSAVGVHNGNSDNISSICTYSLTRGLCYAMHAWTSRKHAYVILTPLNPTFIK